MRKDKTLIPKGYYCYSLTSKSYKRCPYWSINKNYPKQFNGYCSYIEKGDWELSIQYNKTAKWRNTKGQFCESDKFLPLSLLWDQCKECGVNE